MIGPAQAAVAATTDTAGARFTVTVEVRGSCATSALGQSQLSMTCSANTPFAASAGRSEYALATMAGDAGTDGVTIPYAFPTDAAVVHRNGTAKTPMIVTVSY